MNYYDIKYYADATKELKNIQQKQCQVCLILIKKLMLKIKAYTLATALFCNLSQTDTSIWHVEFTRILKTKVNVLVKILVLPSVCAIIS